VGVYSGPEITNDGLVLSLDAANLKGYDKYENLISHSASTSGIVLGAIGSGGSLPTGWVIDQGQPGTTLEVVGYGIEEGLNYIDLKFSGTTSTTNRWLVRPGNAVSLTSGVTYNSSVYAKTISGTPTDFRQFSVFGGGSGASLSGINSTLTRYSGSSAAGSTGTYFPRLDIGYNSIGTVMNFTIRVAGFQAEVGSLVTDYYPTTGTAKTRGTTWTDLTGNVNNGTLTNGPTYSSANGGSIVFDGTNDNVNKSSATINLSAGVTMEMIFKSTDMNSRAQGFMQFNTGSNYINFYAPGNGRLRWETWVPVGVAGGAYTTPTALSNNTWYHAVGTYSNGSSVLYINGVSVASASQTSGTYSSSYTGTIVIGEYAGYMSGNIAKASIYNRALTAQEVQQNFNANRGRFGI
jgi:hypothetical protein